MIRNHSPLIFFKFDLIYVNQFNIGYKDAGWFFKPICYDLVLDCPLVDKNDFSYLPRCYFLSSITFVVGQRGMTVLDALEASDKGHIDTWQDNSDRVTRNNEI